jgi:isovaleryl-CoA dehydrogenase
LPKVLSGEWVGAMGMTEPSSGTDVLGMKTLARRDGEHFILKGRKALITNAPEASVFLIYAAVDGRITSFIVECSFPGIATSKKTPKMGMRGSTMGEIQLDDCRVPAENVLGLVGGGVRNMMRNLEIERLTLAAMSLGIADRCMQIMTEYAAERRSFGKPIAEHGQVQRYIAESYAKTEAMRALIYSVARRVGPEQRNRLGTDAAKLFAAPVGKEVADNAMQVLGGWGYCTEYKVERFLRDAKLLEIGGGTLESHQKNITKELMGPIDS